MSSDRYSGRRPVARRHISPVWLALAVVAVLVLCGCSGLLLHALTSGGGGGQPKSSPTGGSGSAAAAARPGASTPAKAAQVVPHVVPNVVCRNLQTAQDTLQAAGFSVLSSR